MKIVTEILRVRNSKKTLKTKRDGKDQESIQLSVTHDAGYHMVKWQKHN